MRSDIKWLLCERERIGSKKPSKKTGCKLDPNVDYASDEFDSGPSRMKTGKRHKQLNENLNPLFGFLGRAVGRRWDDVYSEIRAVVDHRRAIGFHVLQHLGWHVQLHVLMVDGVPYASDGYNYRLHHGMYVDDKGILQDNPYKKFRWKDRRREPLTRIDMGRDTYFNLEVLQTPAPECGCVHFKYPPLPESPRYLRNNLPPVCIHGNEAGKRPIWYRYDLDWHKPEEVYKVCRFEDGPITCARYNLEPGQTHILYYRDVPDKLKEPIVVRKKVANKKELQYIKGSLRAAESSRP